MTGNGIRAGAKALRATWSITIESLPPENSRHGRCISAATSRKMWMLSASRVRSWVRWRIRALVMRALRPAASLTPAAASSPRRRGRDAGWQTTRSGDHGSGWLYTSGEPSSRVATSPAARATATGAAESHSYWPPAWT